MRRARLTPEGLTRCSRRNQLVSSRLRSPIRRRGSPGRCSSGRGIIGLRCLLPRSEPAREDRKVFQVGAFCSRRLRSPRPLWGIDVGWLMLRLRRWVRDPRIEITLSILTPFLSYWVPEYLGGSGVLATVTTGLYIKLERLSADQRRYAASGHLLLGFFHLPHRRHGVSDYRAAGTPADRAHQ
jgi:hypothetical protein